MQASFYSFGCVFPEVSVLSACLVRAKQRTWLPKHLCSSPVLTSEGSHNWPSMNRQTWCVWFDPTKTLHLVLGQDRGTLGEMCSGGASRGLCSGSERAWTRRVPFSWGVSQMQPTLAVNGGVWLALECGTSTAGGLDGLADVAQKMAAILRSSFAF